MQLFLMANLKYPPPCFLDAFLLVLAVRPVIMRKPYRLTTSAQNSSTISNMSTEEHQALTEQGASGSRARGLSVRIAFKSENALSSSLPVISMKRAVVPSLKPLRRAKLRSSASVSGKASSIAPRMRLVSSVPSFLPDEACFWKHLPHRENRENRSWLENSHYSKGNGRTEPHYLANVSLRNPRTERHHGRRTHQTAQQNQHYRDCHQLQILRLPSTLTAVPSFPIRTPWMYRSSCESFLPCHDSV